MLVGLMSMINNCLAQHPLPCGNGKIDDAALTRAIQLENSPNKPEQVDYLVRVWFHVFKNNDGTNPAATAAQINSEFASLQASYAADNICFLFAGIDSTNSTTFNTLFNADSDPNGAGLSTFQVSGCINIFYMRKINGNNNACNPPCGYGGIALGGIPGTFFLVATGNIGPGNTIGHEMGHCLGLLHTFEPAYGFETINGSNGSTAADKVSDTKADPFAYNGSNCFNTNVSGCAYNGNCQDPNGSTNFTPPYTNIMSYWWAGNNGVCQANPTASNGQFGRVEAFLLVTPVLQACSSPSSLLINPITVSSGDYMKSTINAMTTSGAVVLNSSVNATLGGAVVFLEPGFVADPNSSGLVVIKTKPCQ